MNKRSILISLLVGCLVAVAVFLMLRDDRSELSSPITKTVSISESVQLSDRAETQDVQIQSEPSVDITNSDNVQNAVTHMTRSSQANTESTEESEVSGEVEPVTPETVSLLQQNIEESQRMIVAHSSLLNPIIADPESKENKLILQKMMFNALADPSAQSTSKQ